MSEWREISLEEYDSWEMEEFRIQAIIHDAVDRAKELTEAPHRLRGVPRRSAPPHSDPAKRQDHRRSQTGRVGLTAPAA
jgi:hypothetical protein